MKDVRLMISNCRTYNPVIIAVCCCRCCAMFVMEKPEVQAYFYSEEGDGGGGYQKVSIMISRARLWREDI